MRNPANSSHRLGRRGFFRFLFVALVLIFSGPSGFGKSKKSAYTSKFGVMTPGPSGNYRVYAETTYIYKNVDRDYAHGFEIIRKDGQRFMAQYEIRFPEPISISPELEKAYTVLEGGKLIRSSSEMHWEIFSSPFWFSEDDPIGVYELKIFLDGELYRTINYDVVPFESGF
ncbi:hypothetical protein [Pelagicoccus albus]|uniref:Uncharacterized protein n=1 Tax=Pelagicoccus albus TaxID=415222 RepID=A0A7X1B4C5_9BACT|nr:hypothetical protein [Pelagicoccus albus]MBC2605396.1 hypothetical protein [Pelagicoccus albus]